MTNTNAVPNDTPAAEAPLSYSEAATEVLKALDTIVSLIPNSPVRRNIQILYVRRRQAVKRELIAGAVTTVEATPSLSSLLDATLTRDTLDFNDAFRPVFERMNAAVQGLRFELEARYAKAGADALTVYATAKRLATLPDNPELGSHVATMKPVAAPRKKKRAKAEPPPAATATPATPSVATDESSPSKQ